MVKECVICKKYAVFGHVLGDVSDEYVEQEGAENTPLWDTESNWRPLREASLVGNSLLVPDEK